MNVDFVFLIVLAMPGSPRGRELPQEACQIPNMFQKLFVL